MSDRNDEPVTCFNCGWRGARGSRGAGELCPSCGGDKFIAPDHLEPLVERPSPAVAKAMKRFEDLYRGRAHLTEEDKSRLDEHSRALELEFVVMHAKIELLHAVWAAWQLSYGLPWHGHGSAKESCLCCGEMTEGRIWPYNKPGFALCEACWTQVSRSPDLTATLP